MSTRPALLRSDSAAVERLRPLLPQPLRAHLHSARELGNKRTEEKDDRPLATGVAALDRLLEGGLPRGRMVEVVGNRSSGRFAAALAVLAAVTAAGEAAALVDLGHGLDPESAAELGIDLARLLWVRPANPPQALASAEALIAGGFPLVVLDLGSPPVRGRNTEAPWLRLAREARARLRALDRQPLPPERHRRRRGAEHRAARPRLGPRRRPPAPRRHRLRDRAGEAPRPGSPPERSDGAAD